MIKNIDEASDYFHDLLASGGMTGLGKFGKLPQTRDIDFSGLGLSRNAIDFFKSYDLDRVSLNILNFCSMGHDTYREELININKTYQEPNIPDMYVVIASLEADSILSIKGEDYHEDCNLYYHDVYAGSHQSHPLISTNLENLITIFANVDQLDRSESEFKINKLLDAVHMLEPTIDHSGYACWKRIGELCDLG